MWSCPRPPSRGTTRERLGRVALGVAGHAFESRGALPAVREARYHRGMSQYRDDHAAAQHRIEALETRLREQEAELDARREAIEERDAEIARLRGLGKTGRSAAAPRRMALALASRLVFASFGFVLATVLALVSVERQPRIAPPLAADAIADACDARAAQKRPDTLAPATPAPASGVTESAAAGSLGRDARTSR